MSLYPSVVEPPESGSTTGSVPERMLRALEALVILMGRLVPSPRGRVNARSYTVPVTNVPTKLAPAYRGRSQLTLQNQGVNDVTLGHRPDIVYGQGILLPAGIVTSDDSSQAFEGEWWAIANVIGPVNIGVDDQGG